jgi:hypothetical protein
MKPRLVFYALAAAFVAWLAVAVTTNAAEEPSPDTVQGKDADAWHRIAALYRRKLLIRWKPTVQYAYRLASAVYGVSYWSLHRVGACESNHYVYARNGRYRGVFQEGSMFERGPFGRAGFSVWDPIANALTAASVVAGQGWRQWECRP